MKNLLERMSIENQNLVINGEDESSRDIAMSALTEKRYFGTLTFKEMVAITEFTEPNKVADLKHIVELFQ